MMRCLARASGRALAVLLTALLAWPAAAQLPNPSLSSTQYVGAAAIQTYLLGGASAGQQLYKTGPGAVGGFTQGGDCTTDTSTGLTTCVKLNSIAPGQFYGATAGNGLSCPTAGTAGTCNLTTSISDQSGAGYTILSTDASKLLESGTFTYAYPQAGTAGFTSGFGNCIVNVGAGNTTVNSTTSTFKGAGGATSLTLVPGGWICPASDGTNWITIASGRTTGVTAGSYGDSTHTLSATVTADGKLTALSTNAIPTMNATTGGFVPTPPNDATTCLSGAATYVACSGGGTSQKLPTYLTSNWYVGQVTGYPNVAAGATLALTTAYCVPFWVDQAIHVDHLGVNVTTVSSGGNFQVAIYNSGSWGRPSTLVLSSGNLSTTTGTQVSSSALTSTALSAQTPYWWCAQADNTTAKYTAYNTGQSAMSSSVAMIGGSTLARALSASTNIADVSTTSGVTSFGVWPTWTSGTTWTESTGAAHGVVAAFQVSSVP